MHSPTAKKILVTAQHLLQARGYQFFSFQDLADSVNIRKASVHHYFRTKEDLALAMIGDYELRLERWIARIDGQKLDARQKLRAYFAMFYELSGGGKTLCPGGALLLDWANFSEPVRCELQKLIDLHRRWLQQTLREAVQQKTARILPTKILIHSALIASSVQGALQMARVSQDPSLFLRRFFTQLEELSFKGTRK